LKKSHLLLPALLLAGAWARADVGDPQVKTDHPWYPGELSCSTFERLFATEAALYTRVAGREVKTDEDKALAAWTWRNLHYWHGEEGMEDLFGKGFIPGEPPSLYWTREYWTGLFAHGFGLCGTTHSQWPAEMDALLGRCRGRSTGVVDHASFEVFLTGGAYGDGKWVLLDHDISTVVFDEEGTRLLGTVEIQKDIRRLTDRGFKPERQRGCPLAAYVPDHGMAYRSLNAVAYDPGYAGPPPMVHLRRGEKLRRYLQPGLEDGKTFVFWGRNYGTQGIPGPERSATWVNQPENFQGGLHGSGYKEGRARYANAVYTYAPDFASGDYREGLVLEDDRQVVLEFYSPYIIGATPPGAQPWGIYDPGGKNGLVLHGKGEFPVAVSVDQGRTWKEGGAFRDGMDLTDSVKGHRQYFLRLGAGASSLAGSGLSITTVCQSSSSIIPRLKDGGSRVSFEASNRAILSAGPTIEQARTHLVEGDFGTPSVTLALSAPRKERALGVYGAALVESYNPPKPNVRHALEVSTDDGKTWTPILKDWKILRREPEPRSIGAITCFAGSGAAPSVPFRLRFSNDGRINYFLAGAHLVYETKGRDQTKVTFDWTDSTGAHRASHLFPASGAAGDWTVETAKDVGTRWVEYEAVKN